MARNVINIQVKATDNATATINRIAANAERALQRVGRLRVSANLDVNTRQAERKIDSLERKIHDINRNAASIDVNADTRGAQYELTALQRQLSSLNNTTAQAHVSITAVDAAGLRGQVSRAAAAAEAGQEIKVPVKIDSRAGQRSLSELRGSLRSATGDSDTFRQAIRVLTFTGIITGATLAAQSLSALGAAAFAAASALGPALAGIAAAPALAGAAAQAIGTGALAFMGLGDAVEAMGDRWKMEETASRQSANAARSGASSRESAARQVANAERALADAQRNAARSQFDSNRQVEDAQRALTRAREDGAERVKTAVASVSRAVEAQVETERNAARSIESANRAVSDAKLALIDTQRDAARAQRDLTTARQDAAIALEDLQERATDLALSEQRAALGLQQARERLNDVNSDALATDMERQDALLDVREAEDRLSDVQRDRTRTATELAGAEQAGIEGSDQVVSARERVEESERKVEAAQRSVADAQAGLAEAQMQASRDIAAAQADVAEAATGVLQAQTEAAEGIADAQRGVEDAIRSQQRQQEDSARAIADAQRGIAESMAAVSAAAADAGSQAADPFMKLREATRDLSPAALAFAERINGLRDNLNELRATAAENMFPGLTSGLDSAMTLFPMVNSAVGETARVIGTLGQRGGELLASGPFRADFATMMSANVGMIDRTGDTALTLVDALRNLMIAGLPLAEWVVELANNFAHWIANLLESSRQSGALADTMTRARDVLAQVGRILLNVATALFNTGVEAQGLGQHLLDALETSTRRWADFTNTIEGKNAIRTYFDDARPVIDEVILLIGDMGKAFGSLAANDDLVPLIRQVREELLPALTNLFSHTSTSLGPALVTLATNFTNMFSILSSESGLLVRVIENFAALAGALSRLMEQNPAVTRAVLSFAAFAATLRLIPFGGTIKAMGSLASAVGSGVAFIITRFGLMGVAANASTSTALWALTKQIGTWAWAAVQMAGHAIKMAAQWLIALGPIGWVTAAVIAIAALIIANWDKISAWTRRMAETVSRWWTDLANRVNETVNGWLSRVWTSITTFINDIQNSWNNFVNRIKQWFIDMTVAILVRLLTWVADMMRNWNNLVASVRSLWDGFISGITGAWDLAVNNLITAAQRIWTALPEGAKNMARAVGDWFGDMGNRAKDGVNWLIRNVVNKVIDVWNTVAGWVGLGGQDHVPELATGGQAGRPGGRVSAFATGGQVPGGFDRNNRDDVVARLTRGEWVMPTNSVAKYGPDFMRDVQMGRYALGGDVQGLNPAFAKTLNAWSEAMGQTLMITSGYRSRAEQEVLYARYRAGNGPVAARPGTSRHESGIAADVQGIFKRGQRGGNAAGQFGLKFTVPSEDWHVEQPGLGGAPGGNNSGGLVDWFGGLTGLPDLISTNLAKYGRVGQVVGGVGNKVISRVREWLQAKIDAVAGWFGGDSENGSGGRARDMGGVERWRGVVNEALSMMGLPLSLADTTLRRMNQESSGNPRAINNYDINARRGTPSKGLMQVIDPTFRSYAHPNYNRDIWDPKSNILASMRYALARYGSLPAAYNRPGGYDSGGLLQPGWTSAYNGTGRAEVISPVPTMRAAFRDELETTLAPLMAEQNDLLRSQNRELREVARAIREGQVIQADGRAIAALVDRRSALR